ncbi:hypothetical protein swp_5131 [Shewanella piezotolerans WP3]|uniref:Uncharacterized protein n=1 Tax=Shewanella piezotolerans (strain WP3 / JCM 13877) TaxID=225849 RepID=B8CVS0_SHEPW|nr:hypothetical protein swp_5131 [Shewanella piezotolerans WP3]
MFRKHYASLLLASYRIDLTFKPTLMPAYLYET